MKRFRLFFLSVLVMPAVSLFAQENKAPNPKSDSAARSALTNRCILIVNAAGITAPEMEAIRSFAETDLLLKVKTTDQKGEWSSFLQNASGMKSDTVRLVVILAKGPASSRILTEPDNGWSVVNVSPLLSLTEKKEHMLKQQTMRGIGFALGLPICLDRYCCMRTSELIADIQDAGQNYCPVTRKDFDNLLIQKGLTQITPHTRKGKQAVVDGKAKP